MNEQEKIVCAAIRSIVNIYKDTGKEEIETIIPCIDYDLGQELRGHTVMSISESEGRGWRIDHNQFHGFLTTKNRFVDPVEAQQVAIKSGQYIDPHAKIKSLKELIKGYYLSMKEARSQLAHSSFMKSKNEAQKELEELEAGYLGREFRIEDLHYVKP